MIIKCEKDPRELIEEIGDPNFSICDENYDEAYRHPDHPNSLRIIDCEHNQCIDITGESIEDTKKIAASLLALLNQDYEKKKNFIDLSEEGWVECDPYKILLGIEENTVLEFTYILTSVCLRKDGEWLNQEKEETARSYYRIKK